MKYRTSLLRRMMTITTAFCLASVSIARAADVEKFFPDDFEAVGVLQWDKLVQSKALKGVLAGRTPFQVSRKIIIEKAPEPSKVLNSPEFEKVIETLSTNTTRVTFVATRDGGLFLEGNFDASRLLADVKAAAGAFNFPVKTETIGKNEMVTTGPADDGLSYAVIESNSLIAIGEPHFVFHLLGGKDENKEEARDPQRKEKLLAALHKMPKDRAILLAFAKNETLVSVAVNVDATVDAKVDLDFERIPDAANGEVHARAFLQAQTDDYHRTLLADLIKSVKLERAGNLVTLQASVPAESIGPAFNVLIDPPSDLEPAIVLKTGSKRGGPVAFSRDGKLVATGGQTDYPAAKPGALQVWDIATQKSVFEQELNRRGKDSMFGARLLSFHPNGKWLIADVVSSNFSGELAVVWDIELHRKIKEIECEGAILSPDGKYLALVRSVQGPDVELYSTDTWEPVRKIAMPVDIYRDWFGAYIGASIAFSGDSRRIAVLNSQGRVNVHDVLGAAVLAFVESGQPPFGSKFEVIALSPDGTLLAAGNNQGVYLIDLQTRAVTRSFMGSSSTALRFSADGKKIAAITPRGLLKLLDTGGGETLNLRAHYSGGFGNYAAFSPDGRMLASFTRDKILIWAVK